MDVFKVFFQNKNIDYLFRYFGINVRIVLFVDVIAEFYASLEYSL